MRYPQGVDQLTGFFLQEVLGLNQRLNLGRQAPVSFFPGSFHGPNVFIITIEGVMEGQNTFFDGLSSCIEVCLCGVEIFREGGFGKINENLIIFPEGTGRKGFVCFRQAGSQFPQQGNFFVERNLFLGNGGFQGCNLLP